MDGIYLTTLRIITLLVLMVIVNCRDNYTVEDKFYGTDLGLRDVPDDIPDEAREVYLSNNDISRLPTNVFQNLGFCKLLVLDDNDIVLIEIGAFNNLHNLETLDLAKNQLSQLTSDSLTGLKSLQKLLLFRNKIVTIQDKCFHELQYLTELELGSNSLTELRAQLFWGLTSLTVLYINGNGIETIHDKAFGQLNNLQYLSLHDNMLTELRSEMFLGLNSLIQLTLDGNKLKTLKSDVFDNLPRPLTLAVANAGTTDGNALRCDVTLCWLKREEIEMNITWYQPSYKPVCTDGKDWDTWTCTDETAHPSSKKDGGKEEKEEEEGRVKGISTLLIALIAGGVTGVVFIVVITVAVCSRRKGDKSQKKTKDEGDKNSVYLEPVPNKKKKNQKEESGPFMLDVPVPLPLPVPVLPPSGITDEMYDNVKQDAHQCVNVDPVENDAYRNNEYVNTQGDDYTEIEDEHQYEYVSPDEYRC